MSFLLKLKSFRPPSGHQWISGRRKTGAGEGRGSRGVYPIETRIFRLECRRITQLVSRNMATYKVPQIRLIDEFPLTTTGKVKKEVLKKEFLKVSDL